MSILVFLIITKSADVKETLNQIECYRKEEKKMRRNEIYIYRLKSRLYK